MQTLGGINKILRGGACGLAGRLTGLHRTGQKLLRAEIVKTAAGGIGIGVAVVLHHTGAVWVAFVYGARCERIRKVVVLVADRRGAVELHRSCARRFALGVPVAIGGQDGEVLLAGVLHRVAGHAEVDAVLLAAVMAAHTGQSFAGR